MGWREVGMEAVEVATLDSPGLVIGRMVAAGYRALFWNGEVFGVLILHEPGRWLGRWEDGAGDDVTLWEPNTLHAQAANTLAAWAASQNLDLAASATAR